MTKIILAYLGVNIGDLGIHFQFQRSFYNMAILKLNLRPRPKSYFCFLVDFWPTPEDSRK